jgi:hypothetical protein
MEELIGLDESIYVNVFRIATRTKTSLVYIGNERISMTLHEQSNKALEALEVWQPSPFKNVE